MKIDLSNLKLKSISRFNSRGTSLETRIVSDPYFCIKLLLTSQKYLELSHKDP